MFVTASSYVVYEYISSSKKSQKQKEELAAKLTHLESSEKHLTEQLASVQLDLHTLATELQALKGIKVAPVPVTQVPLTPPPEIAPPLAPAPASSWFGSIGAWISRT